MIIFYIGNLIYILHFFLLKEAWFLYEGKIFYIGNPIYILIPNCIFFLIKDTWFLYEGKGKSRGPFMNLNWHFFIWCWEWFLSILKLEQRTEQNPHLFILFWRRVFKRYLRNIENEILWRLKKSLMKTQIYENKNSPLK